MVVLFSGTIRSAFVDIDMVIFPAGGAGTTAQLRVAAR
jgi:1-aminocyclopropane-1-carboxylate deaminase/D-cysteine desulfhydrase-like pyridoxal-dependent ACC family enzyme